MPKNRNLTKCKVCGALLKRITNTHITKHGITREEYDAMGAEDQSKEIIVRVADSKGEKVCKLCGKAYYRMTKAHLVEHEITREAYDELPPFGMSTHDEFVVKDANGNLISVDNVDALLPKVVNILFNKESFDTKTRRHLELLLSSREQDFHSFLTAYAMKAVARMMKLINHMEDIEKKMYDEDRLEHLSLNTLIKIKESTSVEIDKIVKLLQNVKGSKGGEFSNVFNFLSVGDDKKTKDNVPSDAFDREQVLDRFQKIVELVGGDQVVEGEFEDTGNDDDED